LIALRQVLAKQVRYGVTNAAAWRARPLRAPRANRVFSTDKKRIHGENTVLDKNTGDF
jgi:hypothetical protein